jgi:hypothetical protein
MRRDFVVLLSVCVCAGFVQESAAKCRSLLVTVEGQLEGPRDGNEVVDVTLEPDPQVRQKPIAIKADGSFTTTLSFYTLKGLKREDCTRKPEVVVVSLRKNGELVRSLRLEIGRDFLLTGDGDYRVRKSIALRTDKDSSK